MTAIRTYRRLFLFTGLVCCLTSLIQGSKSHAMFAEIDLTHAVVVAPSTLSGPEKKAVQMLIEEVEKRTQIRWRSSEQAPKDGASITIRRAPAGGKLPPEGYEIKTSGSSVSITGNDARGVLFGVGHLLRTLSMSARSARLPEALNITTAPKYPMRGHQLGYRPKTNSYDAWTLPMWEQYIRELAVFGTNAIELIPPRSDDAADSPHFPLPQIEMMVGMSRVCADYGLDVWIWYPALDKDYSDPKTVEFALKEWGDVFQKLPRIDALLVPGGDPGHTQPKYLMALLEKQTENLHRFHPKAGMWVAPQGFTQEWMDEFLGIVKTEPKWLSGVVYGPQCLLPLPRLREAVPRKFPIRHYPDITHSRHSQFAVPDWDRAFALTEAREVINPRPTQMATVFRLYQPYTVGFITYSEGCNDDVNKIVWNGLGWNPEADVTEILREYSRFFIGPQYEDGFTQGLLALERNWVGPALANGGVDLSLQQFRSLEQKAAPPVLLNWRFQQALYRAYYDGYVRSRLISETALEEQAYEKIRGARRAGTLLAMNEAERILDRAVAEPVAGDLRARVFELGEALFQSIRMQLSVEKYQAIGVGRGANLNTIDYPLNDRLWLKQRFVEIRKPMSELERAAQLDEILNRRNPGPGGFYDDLGNLTRQPHLLRGSGFDKDPSLLESSVVSVVNQNEVSSTATQDFALIGMGPQPFGPASWWDLAETYYDTPLRMRYPGLDKKARYKIRVVYVGDLTRKIRLDADDRFEVHPLIEKQIRPVEFDVPSEATADGELNLSWRQATGSRGAGRGCQVAEVWLIKK